LRNFIQSSFSAVQQLISVFFDYSFDSFAGSLIKTVGLANGVHREFLDCFEVHDSLIVGVQKLGSLLDLLDKVALNLQQVDDLRFFNLQLLPCYVQFVDLAVGVRQFALYLGENLILLLCFLSR